MVRKNIKKSPKGDKCYKIFRTLEDLLIGYDRGDHKPGIEYVYRKVDSKT